MIQAIERYLKQSIVDRNPAVASAALVSSIHLSKEKACVEYQLEATWNPGVDAKHEAVDKQAHAIVKIKRPACTMLAADCI
jgi:hypothetical protein